MANESKVKLTRTKDDYGNIYYYAFDGKYKIWKVKNELGGGYYYCVDNTETGDLVRGNTDRLADVRRLLARVEGVK